MKAVLTKPLTTLLLLTILGLLTFSNLKVIYTGDYLNFILESTHYKSFNEYFLNVLSYNRTRHFEPGDSFLFRPVYHGLHAILDLYFKTTPHMIVFFSLAFHILSSFLLFLIVKNLSNYWVALLSAITYLVQPSGTKVIFDIHFFPYLLTNFYVLFALLLTLQTKPLPYLNTLGLSLLLFIAGCSHESIFLGVIITITLLHLLKISFPKRSYLLSVFTLYLLLNAWSFFYYKGFANLNIGNSANPLQILSDGLISPFYIAGMNVSGLLFGNLRNAHITIGYFICIPLGIWIFYSFYKFRKPILKNFSALPREQKIIVVFSVSFLLAYLVALTLGRGALRGLNYLRWASWDDYLLSPYWIILGALAIKYSSFIKSTTIAKVFLLLWVFQNISASWHQQFFYDAGSIQVVKKAWETVLSPEYCYNGSDNSQAEHYLPSRIFNQYSCQVKQGTSTRFKITVDSKLEIVTMAPHL